jgi:hypothetical protein
VGFFMRVNFNLMLEYIIRYQQNSLRSPQAIYQNILIKHLTTGRGDDNRHRDARNRLHDNDGGILAPVDAPAAPPPGTKRAMSSLQLLL